MKNFFYSEKELKKISQNFFEEIYQGYLGKNTSLSFLKTPLLEENFFPKKDSFSVFLIGGRVFKKFEGKWRNGRVVFFKKEKSQQVPLFKTKKDFFDFINPKITQVSPVLLLSFAFPLKPLVRKNRIDGILFNPTKDHQFKGLVGKKIGEELEKFVFAKLRKRIKIVVVNDTIFLLLSAFYHDKERNWQKVVGGIVGSGTNFSFFIEKDLVVNLESGNFNKFPQTETGKIIDKNSTNPGEQLFEKEVAGVYLYQHYNLLKKDKNYWLSSTKELSKKAKEGDQIAKNLLKRSAQLVASQIGGIFQFKKKVFGCHQIKLFMEGSVFWKGEKYKEYVEETLFSLGIDQFKFANPNLFYYRTDAVYL